MTPITKQSLEELKQKARAATPGPWIAEDEKDHHGLTPFAVSIGARSTDQWIAQCIPIHKIKYMDGYVEGENKQQNAYYIAAASPDVILDLIAQIEGLSEALDAIYFNGNFTSENAKTAKSAIEKFGVK